MPDSAIGLVIYFDGVHIITVNHKRGEARLFENGGSGEGKLVFTSDEPAGKASVNDPFQLIQLGLLFGVRYELLSQVATQEALAMFERLGAQAFIERVASVTTDQERRERLRGLGYRSGSQNKDGKDSEPATPLTSPNGEQASQPPAQSSPPASQPLAQSNPPASSPPAETRRKGTK